MSLNVLNYLQEIVENVLKHLSIIEINKFMILNKVWSKAGKQVKKKRTNNINSYTFPKMNQSYFDEADSFIKNLYSEPKFVLSLYSSLIRKQTYRNPKKMKKELVKYREFVNNCIPSTCVTACIAATNITTYNKVKKCGEELKNAAACIFFPEIQEIDVQVVVNVKKDNFCFHPCKHPINSSMHSSPQSLHHITSSCPSDNLCHQEYNTLYKQPISSDLKVFSKSNIIGSELNESSVQSLSKTHNHTEAVFKTPKLLLYFCNDYSPEHIKQLSENFQCPIAGSLIEHSYAGEIEYPGLGVVFRGGEKMRVAMVVVSTLSDLTKNLRELRASILSQLTSDHETETNTNICEGSDVIEGRRKRRYCNLNQERSSHLITSQTCQTCKNKLTDSQEIDNLKGYKRMHAWAFSCVGNIGEHHLEENSKTFSKIFPDVPLFGTYGMGEIYQNVYGEEEKVGRYDDKAKKFRGKKLTGNFLKSYSTVFVIMGIRK